MPRGCEMPSRIIHYGMHVELAADAASIPCATQYAARSTCSGALACARARAPGLWCSQQIAVVRKNKFGSMHDASFSRPDGRARRSVLCPCVRLSGYQGRPAVRRRSESHKAAPEPRRRGNSCRGGLLRGGLCRSNWRWKNGSEAGVV